MIMGWVRRLKTFMRECSKGGRYATGMMKTKEFMWRGRRMYLNREYHTNWIPRYSSNRVFTRVVWFGFQLFWGTKSEKRKDRK